jgi:hypothetical protein
MCRAEPKLSIQLNDDIKETEKTILAALIVMQLRSWAPLKETEENVFGSEQKKICLKMSKASKKVKAYLFNKSAK